MAKFYDDTKHYGSAKFYYAQLMRERYRAQNPKSMMLRFHAQTGGSTLTAQLPNVNLVRVTMQALMAVLGGTQSLHTNARDEALGLPSEESVRLALRTQQIVAFESGCAVTADPLGGSYAVEERTEQLMKEATGYLEKIDELGGAVAAIEKGFLQREIQEAAYRQQLEIERGERVVVGVNRFRTEQPPNFELFRVDPLSEKRQIERLRAYRQRRDQSRCRAKLESLQEQAKRADVNLMPGVLEAIEAGATLGEITAALRHVFGSYEGWGGQG